MKAGFVMRKEWEETFFMSRFIDADEEEMKEQVAVPLIIMNGCVHESWFRHEERVGGNSLHAPFH
jgi:hypothetical protein